MKKDSLDYLYSTCEYNFNKSNESFNSLQEQINLLNNQINLEHQIGQNIFYMVLILSLTVLVPIIINLFKKK
jgi:hypothetical protein